jgi:hypothetical protein
MQEKKVATLILTTRSPKREKIAGEQTAMDV